MTSSARSWAGILRPCITFDLRSLALLRVGFALALLVDAALRLPDAVLLYADAGLYPRALAVTVGDPAGLSLHLLSGSGGYALLLTALQALAAIALMLGWRTRAATLVAWLLALSASARNPLVVVAADPLMQALLLWGLFLPWHARWSVDRAGEAPPQESAHASWASLALMLQVWVMLLILAGDEALGPAGRGIAGLAVLLLLLPSVYARRTAALLVLVPVIGAGALAGMPGLLCWIGGVLGLALIDGAFWDRIGLRLAGGAGELRLYYRAGTAAGAARTLNRLREWLLLPHARVLSSATSSRVERLLGAGADRWLLIDRQDTAHRGEEALRVLLQHSPLLRPWHGLLGSRRLPVQTLERWIVADQTEAAAATTAPAQSARRIVKPAEVLVGLLAVLMLGAQLARIGGLAVASPVPLQWLGLAPMAGWFRDPAAGWLLRVAEHADGGDRDAASAAGAEPDYAHPRALLLDRERDRAYAQALAAAGAQPYLQALGDRSCRTRNRGLAPADPARTLRLRIVLVLPARGNSEPAEQRVLWRQSCP